MGFAEIENAGKRLLAANPALRHAAKSAYHHISYALSDRSVKCEGEVARVSPDDGYEYFFGYYDKSPWSADERHMLCMRAVCTNKSVAPPEPLEILLLDCENNYTPRKIGESRSWSVQQGCMAQWLGPDFHSKVIYNDFRDGGYRSVIVDVETGAERVLPAPVYAVAEDGSFALTLDFSRLHRLRPGYGYANLPDATEGQLVPDGPCIWRLDLETGEVAGVLGYADFAGFEPRPEMEGAEHKVNHIMLNPSGTRFMVLHRWFQHGKKYTRLVTADADGSGMFNLSDDDFASHCFWKSDDEIISFMRRNDRGDHYYLFSDKSHDYRLLWPSLKTDGHCSYSPDGNVVITDTYPNRKRLASVYLCREDVEEPKRIARVFAPFSYDFDMRCDLHPRWDRRGEKVCFDSVHEGKRGLYICRVEEGKGMVSATGESSIPKYIHYCWFGGGEKSELFHSYMKTWKKHFPDWTLYEWNEESFPISSANDYAREAAEAGAWAFLSDYVRLWALESKGGIYLDTDVEVLRPFDDVLGYDFFVCSESLASICTAVIGASAGNHIVSDLLATYEGKHFTLSNGSHDKTPNTKRFQSFFSERYGYDGSMQPFYFAEEGVILPSELFSPINCYTGVMRVTERTLAIHHYENSWKSPIDKAIRKVSQLVTRVIGERRRQALVKRLKGEDNQV